MLRFPVVPTIAVAALLALAGCTALPVPSRSTSSPGDGSPSPSAKPLACDQLAPQDQLSAALDGSATADDPVTTGLGPAPLVYFAAVELAGGLQCAWTGAADASGLRLTLSVSLLADPDSHWTAMVFGDGPSTETDTFGTHTVTAATGDPGYGVTARIGSTWVFIELDLPPQWEDGTTEHSDHASRALTQVRPFVKSVLDTVEKSDPARLAWQAIAPRTPVTADSCGQYLRTDRMAALTGTTASYQPPQPLSATSGIGDLAAQRAGVVRCVYLKDSTEYAGFDVLRDAAPLLTKLREGDGTGDITYAPVALTGQQPTGWAISGHCAGSGDCGDVIFTLGQDVVDVHDGPNPKAIAEAILGQAF